MAEKYNRIKFIKKSVYAALVLLALTTGLSKLSNAQSESDASIDDFLTPGRIPGYKYPINYGSQVQKKIGRQIIDKGLPPVPDREIHGKFTRESQTKLRQEHLYEAARNGNIMVGCKDGEVYFEGSGVLWETPYTLDDFKINEEEKKELRIDYCKCAIDRANSVEPRIEMMEYQNTLAKLVGRKKVNEIPILKTDNNTYDKPKGLHVVE